MQTAAEAKLTVVVALRHEAVLWLSVFSKEGQIHVFAGVWAAVCLVVNTEGVADVGREPAVAVGVHGTECDR